MSSGIKLRKTYSVGYCQARAFFADRTLGWKKVRFYARSFLLEHPSKGLILIDTGYGEPFLESAKTGFAHLYTKLLPVTYKREDNLLLQLQKDGIRQENLSYVIITHFHPDHIGALPQFCAVPWIYRTEPLAQLRKLSPWKALCKGFFPSLVPEEPFGSIAVQETDFVQKAFSFRSMDLFGDGLLHLVDLPGHAIGQMGVLIQDHFFVADALWSEKGKPHPLGLWLQEDIAAYQQTAQALRTLKCVVIPTHSME